MTLMDSVDEFLNAYVRRTEIVEPVDKKTFRASDYDLGGKWASDRKMTPKLRREIALTAPFFMKATKKKNLDRFRSWFEFENINTRKPPSAADAKIAQLFDARANPKFKFVLANICVDIYGDGFILKKYANDIVDKKGKVDYELPPPKSASLKNLEMINPENLKDMKYLTDRDAKKGKQFKTDGIQHFFYSNKKTNKEMYIHPSRIMHFMDDQLPFSRFGISKVDMLQNIIISEADIDIATGEILKWFSHGTHEITKEGMQPNEKKEIEKNMAQHPNYYVYDSRYHLEVHNPTAIDPKEFYNYIILGIASAFVIPTQVLLGVQIGKVTGAETGYSDYYRDVKDKQELIDTPLIKDLYAEVFAGYNKEFKYEPIWKDIYVGELAEAELLTKRAATVQILLSTNPPVISQEESRKIMNSGKIYLDPAIVVKQVELNDTAKDTDDTENDDEKGNTIARKPLKDAEKKPKKASAGILQLRQEIIDKRKFEELAKKEHALGNKVIEEQDSLFGKDEE